MAVQNPQTSGSDKNFLNNASTALNAYNNYVHSNNATNNISQAFQVYLNPVLPENPSYQEFVGPAPAPQTASIAPPELAPAAPQQSPSQEFVSPAPAPKTASIAPPELTPATPQQSPSQRPKNPTLAPKTPSAIPPKPAMPQKATLPSQGSNTQPQPPPTLQNSKPKPTPEEAAITLQRRFRYRRPALKQAVRKQQPLSDEAALELNLQKRGFSCPSEQSVIPRPAPGTYAVDPKKAKDWVDAHPPEARKLAKQFLSCITYRSQKKFERQLQLTIQDFNRHLASMPADKRDYVLVIDTLDSLHKSNGWVQLLALKYLMTNHLVQIISHYSLNSKSQIPGHNILICDDGAYSGYQIGSTVQRIQKTGKKIFLAIPFMTRQSKRTINPGNSKQIHICKHQIIFTLKELRFPFDSRRSAFIFNHKVPDGFSIPDDIIKDGCLLSKIIPNTANNAKLLTNFPPSLVKVPFINNPNEEPPYKVKSKL